MSFLGGILTAFVVNIILSLIHLLCAITYVAVSLLPVSGLPLVPPIGDLHTLQTPV